MINIKTINKNNHENIYIVEKPNFVYNNDNFYYNLDEALWIPSGKFIIYDYFNKSEFETENPFFIKRICYDYNIKTFLYYSY